MWVNVWEEDIGDREEKVEFSYFQTIKLEQYLSKYIVIQINTQQFKSCRIESSKIKEMCSVGINPFKIDKLI